MKAVAESRQDFFQGIGDQFDEYWWNFLMNLNESDHLIATQAAKQVLDHWERKLSETEVR
jgi:predicted transposase YbfD/YdcC